jgi:hypothetical protein
MIAQPCFVDPMRRFVEGVDRGQTTLFPESLDDWVDENNPVRVIDAFFDALDLRALGFDGVMPEATGRPSHHPAVLLKLYIYGGIVNLTDFASFVPVSGRRGLRTFNGLEASVMHANCSNLLKLTMPWKASPPALGPQEGISDANQMCGNWLEWPSQRSQLKVLSESI